MGAGASSSGSNRPADYEPTVEERLAATTPIRRPHLHVDGKVEYRDEYHEKYDPNIGRLERRNNPVLEAQAAAHWNRMIEFAINKGDANGRPQCPACVRGNHDGPKCRLCGKDVVALKPADNGGEADDRTILNTSRTDDQSPLSMGGGRITSIGDPDHDRETKRRAVAMLLSSSRRKPTTGTQSQKEKKASSGPPSGVGRGGRGGPGRGRGRGGQTTEQEDLLKELEELEREDEERRKLTEIRPIPKEAECLSPVLIELKERTGTSITVGWDISEEVIDIIDELPARPVYELVYRKAVVRKHEQNKNDDDAATSSSSAKKGANVSSSSSSGGSGATSSLLAPDEFWGVASLTEDRHAIIDNLAPNTLYELRCRRKWWSKWGPSVTIRSGPGPPSAPRNITVKEITSHSILISWQAPEEDNGLPVTQYTVVVRQGLAPPRTSSSAALPPSPSSQQEDDSSPTGKASSSSPQKSSGKTTTSTGPAGGARSAPIPGGTTAATYSTSCAGAAAGSNSSGSGTNVNISSVLSGKVLETHSGRERLYLAANLNPNSLITFEVRASNRAGAGATSDAFTVRTLAEGAAAMTPWVEAIDNRTDPPRVYYKHPTTNAVIWTLPKGALIDQAASLRNKRAYLYQLFRTRAATACATMKKEAHTVKLTVSRTNLLIESLQKLLDVPVNELQAGPIRITFAGEEGLDAGGLAKDWFGAVGRALVDRSECLLLPTEKGVINIDIRSSIVKAQEEASWMFRAIGLFIAKALQDGHTLGLNLDTALLLLLAGREPSLKELADADPLYYRGLTWVLENDVTDADLTFSTSFEIQTVKADGEQGEPDTRLKELVPFGIYKEVTEGNKKDYVNLMREWLSRGRFEPGLTYMLEGFQSLIAPGDLLHIRTEELQLLLGGTAQVEVEEIAKDVQYRGGLAEDSPQVKWLWDTLRDFDQKSLSRFLSFVTGCAHFPVDGLHPPLLLTLTPEGGDSSLPKAHTCFNQLVIPAYSTQAVLQQKLQFALDYTDEGFFMT